MKVSIIIPVYNTEKYLHRCIESCLKQTLKGTEIILIDDCSTDNSRNIIKEYAGKYPDIIKYIFQKTNQRQGAARNRGMEIAEGEYFIFVDSDDWIEPDMCEKLYNKAVETNADMVGSDYYCSWDDRDVVHKLMITADMCGSMDILKKDMYSKHYGMFWTRTYKSTFLKKNALKFPENIFYEDAFFNFYSVLYAERIEHIEGCFYHYYQENQSTVRNRNNPHQYERIRLAELILSYGRSHTDLQQYKDIIEYKYLYMQGANLLYTCLGQFDNPDKHMMRSISEGINKEIENISENKSYKQLSGEFRFYLRLNSISPVMCIFCYKHGIYYRFKGLLNKFRGEINGCCKD